MEEQLKIDFDKVIKHLKPSKQEIELREKNLNKFIKNGLKMENSSNLVRNEHLSVLLDLMHVKEVNEG